MTDTARAGILTRLVPFVCWGAWVALVCVWILKNREWLGEVAAFDHKAIKAAYSWNFDTIPSWYLILSIICMVLGVIVASRRWRIWIVGLLSLLSGLGLKGMKWYVSEYEHGLLVERNVVIESAKIKDPIRILHISDLEAAQIGEHERKALQQVAQADVDMVIFTGDFIELQKGDQYSKLWDKLFPLLNEIRPSLGFYGVYGDGDSRLYRIRLGEDASLRMLGTAPVFVRKGKTLLCLKGLSLYQSRMRDVAEHHVEGWLSALADDTFSILVGHGPEYIPSVLDNGIDLCLAGHTHGGQVHLPFLGPLIINSDVSKQFAKGYHEMGNTRVNISAGLGSDRHKGMPIIRFGCPTEMTIIELRPSD
ncbi:MAG: metallophosphoesterase [Opitutales bacterium]